MKNFVNDIEAIAASLRRGALPPVQQWHPDRQGEIDIRIARDGTWYHEGGPIRRPSMVRLFSTILRHDPDGEFYLVTPVEKLRLTVEDAPFVAVEMTVHGQGRERILTFRTNVDDEIMAGPECPIRVETDADSAEPAPYVLVRDGLEALLARPVFYELVDLADEEEFDGTVEFGVWSAGVFFPLGDPGADA